MIELKHNNVKFQIDFPHPPPIFKIILHPLFDTIFVSMSVLLYRGDDDLDMWVTIVY